MFNNRILILKWKKIKKLKDKDYEKYLKLYLVDIEIKERNIVSECLLYMKYVIINYFNYRTDLLLLCCNSSSLLTLRSFISL